MGGDEGDLLAEGGELVEMGGGHLLEFGLELFNVLVFVVLGWLRGRGLYGELLEVRKLLDKLLILFFYLNYYVLLLCVI